MTHDQAIRLLCDTFDSDLILMCEPAQDVYLTAMVHTNTSARDSRGNGRKNVKTGTVEYMVCDGLPGRRSTSLDFFDKDEAIAAFEKIVAEGWPSLAKR